MVDRSKAGSGPAVVTHQARRGLVVASQVLAWFLVVLVLTQAALAGQFVYEDPELIGIHRLIAETLPIVARDCRA